MDKTEQLDALLARTLDACAPKIAAACRAVDGDPDECSLVLTGIPSIGIRFGIPVDSDEDDNDLAGDEVDPPIWAAAESKASNF